MRVFNDGTNVSLRGNQIADRIPVPVGVVEDKNVIHKGEPLFRHFPLQVAVIYDYVRPAIAAPLGGIFSRSGCDDLHLAVVLRKRDSQRSDSTRAANNQQRFICVGILNLQPFKQAFPRGERRQRQCSRGGPVKACRLVPDNARIDQLMCGVAARTGDVACVPHFISRFESGDASPNGFYDPAGIPPENARLLQPAFSNACMYLGVHRVYGDGFHLHQQIVFAGLRHRRGDFNEGGRIFWVNGNGFNRHGVLLNGMRFVEASLLSGHLRDKMDN